jgi:hypothetical protein
MASYVSYRSFRIVLGGGTLARALGGVAGTAAAGAVAVGVTGHLKDQGVPDDVIQNYNGVLASGGAFMTVSTSDEDITLETIKGLITKYNGACSIYPSRGATGVAVVETTDSTTTVPR